MSRYDGTTFTNFRKSDGLSSNEVIRIKEDSAGRIWFFNYNGSLNFFYQNKIFNKTNASFLDSIKNKNFFIDFYQDQDQTIYFYNTLSEIYSLSRQNKVKKIEIDEALIKKQTKFQGKRNLNLRYIFKNPMGDFIFWTQRVIFKIDKSFKQATKIFDSISVLGVFPTRNKSFYISAYHQGIFRFTDEFKISAFFMPFKMENYYSGIKSILEDAGGLLWIVTFDKGVFCLRNNKIVRHFDISEGQSIIQDNENNIWISSMKDGVYKISPYLTVHLHYENTLFRNAGIIALAVNPGGGIWFTNGKIVYLLKNNEFYTLNYPVENFPFNQVYQLKDDTLILGKTGFFDYAFEGISIDKTTKKITYKSVTKTLVRTTKITINKREDNINTFANVNVLIYKLSKYFKLIKEINLGEHVYNTFYNFNDDLIINAMKNYLYRDEKLMPCKELSRFDSKIITDHLILNDSIELYNIEGDSIYLYNQHTFINLTAAFGSPIDLQIRKVTYEEPTLYLSTFRNIYKCENPSDFFKNKPIKLQLVNINFRNIHDILVKNDSIYIASDDGLTIIPEPLNREFKTFTPIPYIQSILVNDIEADLSEQNITLTGNNRIKVIFSSINYSSTPVMYSYMLEGADRDWSRGRGRIVIYEDLPAGNYIFKLRTRKPNSEWSNPVECRILIKSHFWKRPLFLTGMSVLFLILVFLAILRRKNIQIKQREIDHQLITLEQKALQSMMNPHFIFNSLGSIQNYLLQNKSKEAGLYLSQFARLIRQNLNAINAANINLEEEIDRLKNYLDLEKMRMENKFDYNIKVDENLDADEILIPSMIIQPFVENAIWHGIAFLDYRGSIRIDFRQCTEKSLLILVEDNGVGMKRSAEYSIKSEKHVNLGMEMNRRRLDLLGKKYHVETHITFSEAYPDNPNPGTKMELVVPVIV